MRVIQKTIVDFDAIDSYARTMGFFGGKKAASDLRNIKQDILPAQFPLSPMTTSCNASPQQQAITYKILKKGDATMNPTSVEAGAEVAKSAMETVIAAMSDVFTLSGTVVTEITKQPILLFCLAAGLVPVGIHIFSSLKNAARG